MNGGATGDSVLRIITRLNIGGPARHALILSRRMQEQGFSTQLLHGRTGPNEGAFVPEGIAHVEIPELTRSVTPGRELGALRRLTAMVRERAPAIVHTHMAKAGFHGRIAAHRARVGVVVHTFHGHVLEGYFSKPVNEVLVRIERYLARRTDALVAVSPEIRDSLLALGVGTESQWHVVPLGLELDELLASEIAAPIARVALGLPPDSRTIGIVGRLVPIKDVATFLEAATILSRSHPDLHFVIAGDGPLRASLEARSHELLGERVTWLGWVHDLANLYAALDVVVLTSRNEGTPVALIEAAAAGRPVVATAVGGVPDVVKDGKTGVLVPPGQAAAVARAVARLLDDPVSAGRMGAAGRPWVQGRYSSDRLVADIGDLYRELLARKSAERSA